MTGKAVKFAVKFVNRNPRNLELLGLQSPPTGWQLQKKAHLKQFIYKVELVEGKAFQSGRIHHYQDGLVLEASSAELEISSQLFSRTDTCAALNLGRVLAQRCLQSGIHFAQPAASEEERSKSEHQRAFFSALHEGGLSLSAPPVVNHFPRNDPQFQWQRYEVKHDRQDKLDEL